mgnify:CR=1 FL=1
MRNRNCQIWEIEVISTYVDDYNQEREVITCPSCKGTGTQWYPGCGDKSTSCGDCEGIGQKTR